MMRSLGTLRGATMAAAVTLLGGCATPPVPLYLWDSFPKQQYSVLLRDGANPDEQIRLLEAQAEKARAAHKALPPGFRAHLGMLYLGAGNPQRAKDLWSDEKAAFPESAPYIDKLLMRLQMPAQAANTNPV